MALSIPAFTTDQTYDFEVLRLLQGAVATPGVVQPGDLSVSPASGLTVAISSGAAFVEQSVSSGGAWYADGRGLYLVSSGAVSNPSNSIAAPLTDPRIDMVVLQVFDSPQQQLSGSSYAQFRWVTGVETAGATLSNLDGVGTLPPNSLNLAFVAQQVGESAIASGNILQDGGPHAWHALTLENGATVYNGETPSYRLSGDHVEFKGALNTPATSNTVGQLPSAFYPPTDKTMACATSQSTGAGNVGVTTTGIVTCAPIPSGSSYILIIDGCNYALG